MRHKLSHAREDGEFACNLCVKTFTEALTLRSHQRMHSGEKPCICNVCEKSFTNSASLTNHKRMHTGETPFACKLCKKSFTQSIDLKDHQCSWIKIFMINILVADVRLKSMPSVTLKKKLQRVNKLNTFTNI